MELARFAFHIVVFAVFISTSYSSSIANQVNEDALKMQAQSQVRTGHPLGNACSINPCKNGGTCKLVDCNAVCDCPTPYKGDTCEEDLCTPNPCMYNGTCDIVDGKAKCTCLNGTEGDFGEFCEKACFHGSSIVLTRNGEKEMKDLQLDEEVASGFLPDGSFTYSPVIAFLHRDRHMESSFIQLTTDSDTTLLISDKHLIFRRTDYENFEAVHADRIKIGDRVYTKVVGKMATVSAVTSLKSVVLIGIYAPLTLDGTIVVNNVLASCYAEAESHTRSHIVFWPMRVQYYLGSAFKSLDWLWRLPISMAEDKKQFELDGIDANGQSMLKSPEFQGIHWYAEMLIWLIGSK